MGRIGRFLAGQGYQVVNIGYPSRRYPIQGLAACIANSIRVHCSDWVQTIHFVTHSLGGIVLRCYLQDHPLPNLGRVVMLAPPNQGTQLADRFMGNWFYRWMVGPVGDQLGTGDTSVPLQLGAVDYPVGVIAGDKSLNPIFSRLIPGPDDGRIPVERTQLAGMTDFITVPYSHSLMMYYREVIQQTAQFLAQGHFR